MGVTWGVVEVEEVDVVVQGSSGHYGPPAVPSSPPGQQGAAPVPWASGSSLHRGRSMYTWLGNLSCFGFELLLLPPSPPSGE